MAIRIQAPLTQDVVKTLKAGDSCLLSGVIYTARDAAHKRLCELADAGKPLPFDVKDSVIYFVGPTPAKPGQAIGSAGPTTSYRMDAYSPTLIALGQTGMIGKGKRNTDVIAAMKDGLRLFDAKMKGFALPDAVLTAPETRSSSPVRILRDDSLQSSVRGIYPCGEGAGYAGGITSAAVDGIRCAERIIEEYMG